MPRPRSSLAVALEDYKGPRPGVALTLAAIALVSAIMVGVIHIVLLGQSGKAIEDGRATIATLHSYNAALEVWHQMAADEEGLRFPEQLRLRDSIAAALDAQLTSLVQEMDDPVDQELVRNVIDDLARGRAAAGDAGSELGVQGREAMILLTARQDAALFRAAAQYQRSQFFAAVVIGLAVVAAGVLIVPMSWVYVRYKRGIPPGI